ncbi:flagellar hook-associated protein FlgK [Devosia neptuniae]|jgi:flagellar hook-associated protein 1 FlgK|uniref:flagellar hook-associated protein FlgK n=1 Tax=Devosia TaxID=46913 RepID=UPI0022B075C1|nr:flagellar hook-associated protein FlgK [Devosia neptuniae]MCZ4345865.1 flagellar hook-associated protein FlgK [Devosia neptuniae]|tara:strand:+ start:43267 stop:45105 length:1839 start_codon:yes stop_codon:yes gene_type:complete
MGLTTSLTNAVSGLRVNQDSLGLVSRNIANSGTPGYHKQSLNVVDYNTQTSSYARSVGANRAFNASLQTYYNRQVSDTANSSIQASYLDRLQGFLGKPGTAGSLDTLFSDLQNSLQSVATSPDDYTTRSNAVASAQNMAETLNRLSNTIQGMRQETEGQIASNVHNMNGMLNSLAEVNNRMLDLGMTDSARSALLDQRDRLVGSVAELIDVRADYRGDGTVALMTRSGVGLLDNGVSTFSFESAGSLSANSVFDPNSSENKVGKLSLTTPSGLTIDLVTQGVLQGGELGGLVTLRDKTLVEAQEQLDEIASGLAQAFSTVKNLGVAATDGVANGFDIDLTTLKPGNDVLFTYSENGVNKQVRVVNSTDPVDYMDASGQRVIGIDLSGNSTAAAAALNAKFSGLAISSTGAGNLRILDDGAIGATDVKTAVARSTSTGLQGAGLAFNLFVDQGNTAFTNNLDSDPPQKQGFAARISVNTAIVANNKLMVQHEVGGTLGDADRANYIIDQLASMSFTSGGNPAANADKFQLTGNLGNLIGQVLGFQGGNINAALTKYDDRQLTLDTISDQMQTEYGVNLDEEMARLMELQNAYAANARVVSVVKELLDALLGAV